ncbi:MAG: helix-turn-helix transcriptional regulator [Chloroflexota bacterium]
MAASSPSDSERRKELADFLRTRRQRLRPDELGLPSTKRRRTPGLRREELAYLAGVGVTWYTWLEQGRPIRVSAQVLESVAAALLLDSTERRHLFALADDLQLPTAGGSNLVRSALQQLLDQQEPSPAYVMGSRWDVLAWNHAASAVLADFEAIPVEDRNMVWLLFTDTRFRRLLVDWEAHAQAVLAQFRTDCGFHVGERRFANMIDRLRATSPEFGTWWQWHDVRLRPTERREFNHPIAGRLVLQQFTFVTSDNPDLRVVVYVPLPEADSARKLQGLAHHDVDFA